MNKLVIHILYILFFLFTVLFKVNAQDYLKIVESFDTLNSVGRSRMMLGYITTKELKEYELLSFLKACENYAIKANDTGLLDQINYFRDKKRIVYDRYENEFELKVDAYYKLLNLYKDKNKPLFVGAAYHQIGQIQFDNGDYAKSFENSYKSFDIFEKIGYNNIPEIGKYLHDVALNNFFFKEYQEVIRLMHISIKLPKFSENLDIQRYNNLGVAHSKLNNIDSARYYLGITKDLAYKYKSDVWKGIVAGNLGDVYFQENNYEDAYKLYKEQLFYTENFPNKLVELSGFVNMIKILVNMDSIPQANNYIRLYHRHLNFIKPEFYLDNITINKLKRIFYEVKKDYHQRIGNYKTSLEFADSLQSIVKEIDDNHSSYQIRIVTDQIKNENSQIELEKIKLKKNKEEIYMIIFFFVVLGLLFIVYFYLKALKESKRRLNEQLIYENKISNLQKFEMNKELLNAKKQLSNFINRVEVQEAELENLRIKILGKSTTGILEDLIKEPKFINDKDWTLIINHFKLAHPDIYNIIFNNKKFSLSEAKFLMMSYLGYSNKDISLYRGVSEGAIRITLNRLRNKWNFDTEVSAKEMLEIMKTDPNFKD